MEGSSMNTMSVDEYRRLVGTAAPAQPEPAKKPAKYRNEPVTIDGVRFDSKAEARRWQQLQLMERAGELTDLERQTPFRFCLNGRLVFTYRADATYKNRDGALTVEDTKGGDTTPLFKLKKKIIEAQFGITIQEHRA
jgi:ethanolamine ammonia-lyase small subunit